MEGLKPFASSTQLQRWLFTAEELKQKREGVVARLKGNDPKKRTLNVADEKILRRTFEMQIVDVCKKLQGTLELPKSVQGAAVCYFKRFYLERSLVEYDPKNVTATCIFIACKVEEHFCDAQKLASCLGLDSFEEMLEMEPIILNALNFDLLVHQPYRSLDGFFYALTVDAGQGWAPKDQQKVFRSEGNKMLDAAWISDAIFLFPPAQIALTVMRRCGKHVPGCEGAVKYVDKVVGMHEDAEMKMIERMENIDAMIAEAQRDSDAGKLKNAKKKLAILLKAS